MEPVQEIGFIRESWSVKILILPFNQGALSSTNVLIWLIVGKSSEEHHHYPLSPSVQVVGVLLEVCKLGLVYCKDGVVLHIVETVQPQCFHGDLVVCIILYVSFEIANFSPSIGCNMPAKGPERWEFWKANELLVIGDDLSCSASSEKVDVKVATSGHVAQNIVAISVSN